MNPHSLKFRLTALILGLAIFGLIVRLTLALPLMQEKILELQSAQQMSVATAMAKDVDYGLTTRLRAIQHLAQTLPQDLLHKHTALQAWGQEHQAFNPLFNSGLMIVPPEGRGLIGETPIVPGREQLDYTQSDWFQAAQRSNGPVMGKPARGRATGDPLIVMAAPVRDKEGRLKAVIAGVALLNTPGFLDKILEGRLGHTGGFLLISPRDQWFVASSIPEMVLQPTPAPGINLLHDRAMGGYRGTGITINAKGVEELSSMVSIPSTGWFLVARMPTSEALEPIRALREMNLKSTLIVLGPLLVMMFLLLSRLLRPLQEASTAIHAMAEGSQPLAPLPIRSQDEVAHLTQGFNHLVQRLQEQEAALRASEARLAFMAQHDPLTHLPNRALLEERLHQALAQLEREPGHLALLFCDLDGFKAINDQHGHEVGDEILMQVAERLQDGRRSSDTVARLGGDEFIILLTDLTQPEQAARAVAEQCLSAIRRPFMVRGLELSLGISIGITLHGDTRQGQSVSGSHLLSQADMAMYQVKASGKGSLAFFTPPIVPLPPEPEPLG